MTAPALAFGAIRFAYNGAEVLGGIELAVAHGGVTALMGPSGCGKSTLMALAAGLLAPDAGTIRRPEGRIGMMFQDPLLLPWRTALDNVGFALKADGLGKAERRARARDVLARTGLEGADVLKYPRQLSGGMRQRVALARALVVAPDLLLLDEPFSGLDGALQRQMLAFVRTLVDRDGVSALVVTHDAGEAARFAERVYVMSACPAKIVAMRDIEGRAGTRSAAEIADAAAGILADLS